jgi:penicillin-binding protein 1A
MTSILEGVVKRGTAKKINDLNLDIAGKTGTTNKNTDTWFIGFTSKLVIGVYVGLDEPKTLGKFETGSKTAMPIFKSFVKKAIQKKDARPFKVADNITMMVVDRFSGFKAKSTSKQTIVEVFKKNKINKKSDKNLDINNRLKNNNILKFY